MVKITYENRDLNVEIKAPTIEVVLGISKALQHIIDMAAEKNFVNAGAMGMTFISVIKEALIKHGYKEDFINETLSNYRP